MFPKPLSTGRWRCNRKLAFGFFLFFTQLIGCMSQPQIPKVNFFLNSKHVPIIWSTLPLEALPSSPPLPIHNGVCHPTWELPQGVVSIRKWRSSTSTGTSAWSGMSFSFFVDESWKCFRIFGGCGCWLIDWSQHRGTSFLVRKMMDSISFFWGGCRFGVKNGLRHWVGEKGRGGARHDENVRLWDLNLLMFQVVNHQNGIHCEENRCLAMKQFPLFRFTIREALESLLRVRSPIIDLMIFDGSEVLQLEFNDGTWRHTQGPDTPWETHNKNQWNLSQTQVRFPARENQNPGGFSARITSNESLFSGLSYRTSLDSSSRCEPFAVGTCYFDNVGLLQMVMLVMFLVRSSCWCWWNPFESWGDKKRDSSFGWDA